jgi:tRNA dimethylallyltransferase
LGPTSSGKSDIAIKLARQFNGEIISADSRQIYRGLDIGTGKVTKAEQNMAKHWLLDIVSPRTIFSAAQFKKKADKIIADILRRGKLPIICGGTGFWIKAVVDNVSYPEVKPDWQLREKLGKKSAAALFKMLKKIDPQRAQNIDAKNPVRLIRAIEICKAIGKVPPLSCHCESAAAGEAIPLQQSTKYNIKSGELKYGIAAVAPRRSSLAMTNNYEFLQISVDITKENLHKNIEQRLRKRWAAGMIKEVKNLKKSGLSWKKIQSFGLGYFWIPLYLQKKITKQDLLEKVFLAEKDFAKRQMTWFKKDERIKWLKKYSAIKKETAIFLKNN